MPKPIQIKVENLSRARSAYEALKRFCRHKYDQHANSSAFRSNEMDNITDLLTDILHMAHQRGHDPLELVGRATTHFKAEV